MAFQLSGERDFADSADSHVQIIQDLEDMLSVKQMTIEILALIDHHHHAIMPKSVDVERLARYTLALGMKHLLFLQKIFLGFKRNHF